MYNEYFNSTEQISNKVEVVEPDVARDGLFGNGTLKECMEVINEFDYNNDNFINFREFTAIFYWSIITDYEDKYKQLDCSACTDEYDV